jgi:hypothetical protein
MPEPVPALRFSTTTTAKPAAPPAPEPAATDKMSFRVALEEAKKKQPIAKRASDTDASGAAKRSGKTAAKRQAAKPNSPAGQKKPVAGHSWSTAAERWFDARSP